MIRFYAAYIYCGCDRARSYSNGYVRSRLNGFIRTLKLCFVFITLVSSDQDFISNVVIVIDSCGVFSKLRIFLFALVSADVCISNSLYD